MKPLELSHDIIAKKVWERLPEIDKQLQAVKKSLVQRQQDWAQGKGSFLGAKELAAWEAPIERLHDSLDQEVLDFIDNSKKDVEKKKKEKARQLRRDAQRKRTRLFLVVTTLGFLLAVALAMWAFSERNRAEKQTAIVVLEKQKAEAAQQEAEVQKHIAEERLKEILKSEGASPESQISLFLTRVAERLEEQKLAYISSLLQDNSGIFHQMLQSMKDSLPDVIGPTPEEARSTRQIAYWYYQKDNLFIIQNALAERNKIRPGSVLFFGRSNEHYTNLDIDLLSNPGVFQHDGEKGKIFHMGVVTSVERDAEGKIERYTLMHGRNSRYPASRTTGNWDGPGGYKKVFAEFPFGNWNQQLVAIAYPLGSNE